MWCSAALVLSGAEEPEGLLDRFREHIKTELGRLPDYVCSQTVERLSRPNAQRQWQKVDTLRLDVAFLGDQELYGAPGAAQFHQRPLEQVVGRGTVSTGRHGLLTQHIFATTAATFTYRGEGEQNDRAAYMYDYDVSPDRSNYRLRSGGAEATAGFQGTFWIDSQTLDLLRLEVQAYDIAEELGLAEANTSLFFSRLMMESRDILVPVLSTVTLVLTDGLESLNRTRLSGCRQYQAESTIQFAGEAANTETERAAEPAAERERHALQGGTLVELALDGFDPEKASVGDGVTARVSRAVKDGERVLIPQGSAVLGNIVRLERETMPFPIFEIGLEFHTLQVGERNIPFSATMEQAGPQAGLIRQAKRLDPTFTRRRTGRMDILVREVQQGQGILHWDARRGAMPKGLQMKWRVQKDANPEF
jgi:hypothetical protein